MLAGKPKRKIVIEVHRDHTGRWWIEDETAKRIAPYLEPDSSIMLECLVCASDANHDTKKDKV